MCNGMKVMFQIQDGKDGTCAVEYFPVAPGEYVVNITYGGENINGSPFAVNILDTIDPTKVWKSRRFNVLT